MSDIDESSQIERFEIEIADLDLTEFSETSKSADLGRWFLRWQQPARRRLRLWFKGLLLVGLLCALVAIILSPATGWTALLVAHWSRPPAQALVRASNLPVVDGILCPVQTAWSPDSAQVAILGYTHLCTQDTYVPAQINFYNAANSREIAHWQPDDAVLVALAHSPYISPLLHALLSRKPYSAKDQDTSSAPAIAYQQMIWSPDGTRLAVSFTIVTRVVTYAGIFLADRDGSHSQVFFQPTALPSHPFQSASPLVWNLQSGHATILSALAPALAYMWDQRDQLVPISPLIPDAQSSAYITTSTGNPDGGQCFTIWQPGHPIILSSMHMPSGYLWFTDFAAWSPDGRYLLTSFTFTGLMEPVGHAFPKGSVQNQIGVNATPHILTHDPVLLPSAAKAQIVAWNPSGTILAVYDLSDTIDLYNTHSGVLLRELKPTLNHPLDGSAILLSWSPDGHSLLLSSFNSGLFSLWGSYGLSLS